MNAERIEYTYTVTGISDDGTTATVTYTPADDRLKPVNRAVPVPIGKARDADHARQILEQKVRQRAPLHEWGEALQLLEGRKGPSVESLVSSLRESVVGKERRIEPPKEESPEERIRREFLRT